MTNPIATGAEPRARVLIIDDELPLAQTYQRYLRRQGFDADVVGSSREADARLRVEGAYDVVLADVMLPDMNGLELVRLLRQRNVDLPVVLMSGMPTLESAFEAIEQGALRYLSKPFQLERLREAIESALRAGQTNRRFRDAAELLANDPVVQEGRRNAEARVMRAMATMYMHYQPIVSRHGELYAYEALLRCSEPTLLRPDMLVALADRLGHLVPLARKARALVAEDAARAPADVLFFVNLHPRDLCDEELYSPTAPLTRVAHRVVLEITERTSLHSIGDIVERVARLRSLGFRIAIDDLGDGYAGLSSFAMLNPDIVKIDKSLVNGVPADHRSRHVVRAICELSHQLGIEVVSEGVETLEQAAELRRLGTDLLQGYLLARPAPPFCQPQWPATFNG